MNSLAVLGAVKATGGDAAAAAAALATMSALDGRGRRHRLAIADGEIELIDESYNASPASMRAAFAVLAAAAPGRGGRRIAVLGDMLELGDASADLHAALAGRLVEDNIDLVFTVGRDMRALHETLPAERRGAHAATSAEMTEILAARLRAGDVVTVKGSFGSRMGEVVKHLLAGEAAHISAKG
jgi:UDP-N-acetylmuramoyl-tripeptide--D-alanyl-D-alanine ligase